MNFVLFGLINEDLQQPLTGVEMEQDWTNEAMKRLWGSVNRNFGSDLVFAQNFKAGAMDFRFNAQVVYGDLSVVVDGIIRHQLAGLSLSFSVNGAPTVDIEFGAGRRLTDTTNCHKIPGYDGISLDGDICFDFDSEDDELKMQFKSPYVFSWQKTIWRSGKGGTADCLKHLARAEPTCMSVFTRAAGNTFSTCTNETPSSSTSFFARSSSCSCNPVVQDMVGLASKNCTQVESSEYGCEMMDATIDQQRITTLQRFNAAFNLPNDEFESLLREVFAPDVVFQILGAKPYIGVEAAIKGSLFLNPIVSQGLVAYGSPVETLDLDLDANGVRGAIMEYADAYNSTVKYVQGSYYWIEFQECTSQIRSILWVLDDFSFTTTIVAPHSLSQYAQSSAIQLPEVKYDFESLAPDQIEIAKHWAKKFFDVGSHECIDGMWSKAAYLGTWQDVRKIGGVCLILGQHSYLKIFESEDRASRQFALNYEHYLRTIDVNGHSRFEITTDETGEAILKVTLTFDGRTLGNMEIALGSSNCINLWMVKYCGSWGADRGARSLEGRVPDLQIYMDVDEGKTEKIMIWDPNPPNTTTTTTTTPPMGAAWEWSASLSGPIAALSTFALRYI
jgi:hypothetical protein